MIDSPAGVILAGLFCVVCAISPIPWYIILLFCHLVIIPRGVYNEDTIKELTDWKGKNNEDLLQGIRCNRQHHGSERRFGNTGHS